MTRTRDLFASVHTEGTMLPPDLLQRVMERDKALAGLTPADYHHDGERLNELAAASWQRLQGRWLTFKDDRTRLAEGDTGTRETRERWLLPLFQEFDYGRLQTAKAIELGGRNYAVSHAWQNSPIHLVGCNVDLDRKTAGVAGAARTSPHSLLQELLNRSDDHLWAFVSNGLRLRILRDNVSLSRQAYVEFDLEAMMEGELYSDFVLLWLLCHQSRVEGERPEECWLERWSQEAQQQGVRALDGLRKGVEEAIEALGSGFLKQASNQELLKKLRDGGLDKQDYYRQLLRMVYRLLFLFAAEDRGLLLDPAASEAAAQSYVDFYSTERLRRLAERRRGSRHTDLFESLRLVMQKLGGDGCPELGLPALGSMLFTDESVVDLLGCRLANRDLLKAARHLAFTSDGHSLRPIDFRNLGAEELGSVYESLLEMQPDLNREAATFELRVVSGSERKTTGSYYTPSSLIHCLLDTALDPVVDERLKAAAPDGRERTLLDLKVCDPACGSGHFLIAAAHRLARRLAAVRSGDDEPAPEATRQALRDVIGHCIYGVDINPMSVELCKVNLWMEALEPGKPLSFLDSHVKCGNSLLGTNPDLLAVGIPDDAFKPVSGDETRIAGSLRRRNKREREGQLTFGDGAQAHGPALSAEAASVEAARDDSIPWLRAKQHRFMQLLASEKYRHAKLLADAWCAAFVQPMESSSTVSITTGVLQQLIRDPDDLADQTRGEIERLAHAHRFFHWHIEFSAVLERERGGFDLVLGNPPFVNAIEGGVNEQSKKLMRFAHELLGGTSDLAYYFLSTARRLVRSGGRIALVQPRAVLNAGPVRDLRAQSEASLRPNLLYAPNRSDFFAGPAVFICLVVLGPMETCRVSRDDDPATAEWAAGSIRSDNWWLAIDRLLTGDEDVLPDDHGRPIEELFAVSASMTTADAYDVAPWVLDEPEGSSQKLVTTGLIDPGCCLWGKRPAVI